MTTMEFLKQGLKLKRAMNSNYGSSTFAKQFAWFSERNNQFKGFSSRYSSPTKKLVSETIDFIFKNYLLPIADDSNDEDMQEWLLHFKFTVEHEDYEIYLDIEPCTGLNYDFEILDKVHNFLRDTEDRKLTYNVPEVHKLYDELRKEALGGNK